jgi:hypothetical protein
MGTSSSCANVMDRQTNRSILFEWEQLKMTTIIAELLKDERLLNLTSALKTFHGQKMKAVLPIFRHWVRFNCDITEATPEWHQEVEEGYVKLYHLAKSLEHARALDVLEIYSDHFFKTATTDERAVLASALGCSSLEYEIRSEGFSMRELMQALKIFDPVPEGFLTACFERYVRDRLKQEQLLTTIPQIMAQYRREPAMKSVERAGAILKEFGVRLLNANDPDDLQTWKEVSGAGEH